MSEVMTRTVEGTHIRFIRQIMVNREQRNTYGTWETPVYREVVSPHTSAAGRQR